MQLDIIRLENAGARGILSANRLDGVLMGFSMEPPFSTDKKKKPRCIPKGTYKATRSYYKGHAAWLLQAVPGFTGVFIHIGQRVEHTLACILMGCSIKPGKDRVLVQSTEAIRRFEAATAGVRELSVNIVNRW